MAGFFCFVFLESEREREREREREQWNIDQVRKMVGLARFSIYKPWRTLESGVIPTTSVKGISFAQLDIYRDPLLTAV